MKTLWRVYIAQCTHQPTPTIKQNQFKMFSHHTASCWCCSLTISRRKAVMQNWNDKTTQRLLRFWVLVKWEMSHLQQRLRIIIIIDSWVAPCSIFFFFFCYIQRSLWILCMCACICSYYYLSFYINRENLQWWWWWWW